MGSALGVYLIEEWGSGQGKQHGTIIKFRLQGVGHSGTDSVGPPPAKSDQVILGIMLGLLNIIVLVPRLLGTPTCIDFYGFRG